MADSANQLPPECIGRDRLLSRALYRAAMDYTPSERPGMIYRLHPKRSPEVIADHIRLLPQHAIAAIRDSLDSLALEQQIQRECGNESTSQAEQHLSARINDVPFPWVAELRRQLNDVRHFNC